MAPCAALAGYSSEGAFKPTTTIASSSFHAATGNLPEHCEIVGHIDPRTGIDGQSYVIRYHLRLPTTWNDRLYFQGGGGPTASGDRPPLGAPQGYAVVSTGRGTTTPSTPTPTAALWPLRAIRSAIDFGYNAPTWSRGRRKV
jgi:feruloyl esterase